MRGPTRKAALLCLGLLAVSVVIVMSIGGCEEQNLPDTKKGRLIAAENIQLKKQLEKRDEEIKKQTELLNKCMDEKKALQKQKTEETKKVIDLAMKSINKETVKLRAENKSLKAEIEKLKK